ncbi:hypothetical protein M2650_09145 [Luteimonas sp. SX5]|uniref:DUF202 domain-containing protein n=1 Tax=Luteimonas galliterrae TaxID=2940486 RepID=A0ABT0MIV5_9GAMM|nr:hypothetical protein [Luteimonas galliterrae]MCL1634794.1 hypothetical protein [Luteimonas galliterrae]
MYEADTLAPALPAEVATGLEGKADVFMLGDSGNTGLGMVILGLALLLRSIYRYWRVGHGIEHGRYVARRRGTLVASLGLFVLGGLTAVWLSIRSAPAPT